MTKKTRTLRQFTNLLLRYLGRKTNAYPYARALQEAGLAELGKTNEPYSLSRPSEMRVVPGQGVVAQTPVLTKSVDPNIDEWVPPPAPPPAPKTKAKPVVAAA